MTEWLLGPAREWFILWWPAIAGAITFSLSLFTSVHALLHKRQVQSAIGWVALCWLAPIAGALLYTMLGMNRIRRRATAIRGRAGARRASLSAGSRDDGSERVEPGELARLMGEVTGQPLLGGNHIEPLLLGDRAYPEMLEAIRGAETSVTLLSYIFDADPQGRRFVDALADATERGVQVRVLVDAAGARYSRPTSIRLLRDRGVNARRFMPALVADKAPFLNLRNHRKILVVDGRIGFTGGMNIRADHVLGEPSRHPTRDLHFRVEGPVVAQLQRAFADDWTFTAGEALSGPAWFPPLPPAGAIPARGIPDGPDEDYEKIRWTLTGAIGCARRELLVMTPYFLPDPSILDALSLAAMRGVDVQILIPARSNLPLIDWAMTPQLGPLLRRGCKIWRTPPPFDHTKLVVVDRRWSLLGSTNWDARSLQLNFEFNLEAYDADLAGALAALVEERRAEAQRVTTEALKARGPWPRLRDGLAWLLTPYL